MKPSIDFFNPHGFHQFFSEFPQKSPQFFMLFRKFIEPTHFTRSFPSFFVIPAMKRQISPSCPVHAISPRLLSYAGVVRHQRAHSCQARPSFVTC
jgi:hypothetical protein